MPGDERGRGGVLSGRAALAALLFALGFTSPASALEQPLLAADGVAGDHLGWSVAVSGDVAAVGTPYDNGLAGAVYVFERSGDSWSNTAKLTASDGVPGDQLGWSVAISGDQIVAGAPVDTVGGNGAQGSVYTFATGGAAARSETAKLTAADGAPDDHLGYSVAISAEGIVAGAPEDDVSGNANFGSAYTFASAGAAARTQTAKLRSSDGAPGDALGYSVAISADGILVGAPLHNVGQGSAYAFEHSNLGDRLETARLTASDGAPGDELGRSVAISASGITAGAPFDDVGANVNQGSAYTFATAGAGARTQTAKLTASDGAPNDQLAAALAVSGDRIVAGASFDDVGVNTDQGSAYTFAATGGDRVETAKLTAASGGASDLLGQAVAISADRIVAGAPLDDIGINGDQGSATVFFSPATPPDTEPPETQLTKRPKNRLGRSKAVYRFSSSEPGSTFECKLDRKGFEPCSSPRKLKRLKARRHKFKVRAIDAAGNVDPTPAKDRFKVRRG